MVDPTNDQDATTKKYVDDNITGFLRPMALYLWSETLMLVVKR